MSVDFRPIIPDPAPTPGRGNYTDLQPFRFWCQKVLPLVYDESLSYYELLCKVVDYLNKTMEDVGVLNDDIGNLYDAFTSLTGWTEDQVEALLTAYSELQDYVNNYFDNLNVQQEINNKLDAMAADGSLLALISATVIAQTTAATESWLTAHVNPETGYVIDNSLTVSGAAADALAAGTLIRGNTAALNNDITMLDNGKRMFDAPFHRGTLKYSDGSVITANNRIVSDTYFQFPYDLPVEIETGWAYAIVTYDSNYEITHYYSFSLPWTIPANTIFRVTILRDTEDPTETADIEEFRNKLWFYSNIEKRFVGLDTLYTTQANFEKEFVSNIFNKDAEYVADSYTTPTGITATLAGWGYIDLPVQPGKKLSCYSSGDRVMTCFYNGNTVIEGGANNNPWEEVITLPDNITRIRISCDVDTFENIMLCYYDTLVNTVYPYGDIAPSPNLSKYWGNGTVYVRSGDSLLEGVMSAYENGFKEIVVEAGTYDLIQEYEDYYGDDCFIDYVTGYNVAAMGKYGRGLWLDNITIKFSPGARVTCDYEGSNTYVKTEFSAIAVGNNVKIDGLVLHSRNVRYGVHADFNSGADLTTFEMVNCDLDHYRQYVCQAIGAGLGYHVDWKFENIIFRSTENDIYFRIHNNVSSGAQSKVVVKNCYIEGPGYMAFNSYSTSTDITTVIVTGCSWINEPVNNKETISSEDNVIILAYCNETRES